MDALQEYVGTSGLKHSVPELCVSVGLLLEEVEQFRSATRLYAEALRVMDGLMLHHPYLQQAMHPDLPLRLLRLWPKVRSPLLLLKMPPVPPLARARCSYQGPAGYGAACMY